MSANAIPGGVTAQSMAGPRPGPRQISMVGMQRMPVGSMAAFNIPSQAGMNLNPGGIPMQRGPAGQAHPQQVHNSCRCFNYLCSCISSLFLMYLFLSGTAEKEGSGNGHAKSWVPSTKKKVLM